MTPDEYEMIERISERAAERACMKATQPLALQFQSLKDSVESLLQANTPFAAHPVVHETHPVGEATEKKPQTAKTIATRVFRKVKDKFIDYCIVFVGSALIYWAINHGWHPPAPPTP
jgi:hypothetical protein